MGFPPHIPLFSGTNAQNWINAALLGAGPGIYLAISSLGAGAGSSNSAFFSSVQNTLGNLIFGVASFFAPIWLLYVSPRWLLIMGPSGYAVYIIGLIYFQHEHSVILPLILSIYFGLGSSAIWVGTTYISMAYSTKATKGTFVNNQWVGLALGSTVGSAIAFGANIHKKTLAGVSYGVLGGWTAIHLLACVVAFFFILPPNRVRSPLGHPIPAARDIMGHEVKIKHILKEIGQTLISPKVLFAAAAMLSSDFWLVFIGSWNASHFTLRTRSLNSFCYWILQIPVAYGLSKVLDRPGWSPRKRGTVGFSILFTLVLASWIGLWSWQAMRPEKGDRLAKITAIDWKSSNYAPAIIVYLLFGISYPILSFCSQYHVVLVYYFSSLASEGDRKVAYYAGVFKGLQGLGLGIAFGIDSTKPNWLVESGCMGAVSLVSLLPLFYGFRRYVSDGAADANAFEEEMTVESIAPTTSRVEEIEEDKKITSVVVNVQPILNP